VVEWYEISVRSACCLLGINRSVYYYRSHKRQYTALRLRLKELALSRVRYGYIRLMILLRREGWRVGKKLVYRLYTEMGLTLKSKRGRKLARRGRISRPPVADAPNQRWCMDFVTERFENGRYFRILTVMDQYTRECLALETGVSMSGTKVACSLNGVVLSRGSPESITMDNGTEFQSRAMDAWAYEHDVRLDFIRPGRPVENGLIESFNGRLRDECLNVHLFWNLEDARKKLEEWRLDYNSVRPHSSLGQLTPEEYSASVCGQEICGLETVDL
jgi:putative transposase